MGGVADSVNSIHTLRHIRRVFWMSGIGGRVRFGSVLGRSPPNIVYEGGKCQPFYDLQSQNPRGRSVKRVLKAIVAGIDELWHVPYLFE
jgi:hypothetical protein